jgi:hypothetical protein
MRLAGPLAFALAACTPAAPPPPVPAASGEVQVALVEETGASPGPEILEGQPDAALRRCHAEAPAGETGWMVVRLGVAAGRVERAEVVESGGLSPGTIECARRALGAARLDPALSPFAALLYVAMR